MVAAAALAAALAGAALLVDPAAEASFDAPKRAAALLFVAVAAAAAFLWPSRRVGTPLRSLWRGARRSSRIVLVLALAALGGAVVSALASPRQAASLDALRGLLVFSLLLPLGASRVTTRYGRPLLLLFFGLCAVNLTVSLLQGWGIYRPLPIEVTGARAATGAFAGNVGYLALALALAGVAAMALAVESRRPATRVLAAVGLALSVADLVVNQNLTSLTALAAGALALLLARRGRRAFLPIVGVAALAAAAFAIYRPAQTRLADAVAAARTGDWDALLTYRLGPWSAAAEMARERPVTGFGPGTFSAEFVRHRLAAEIRARRRYVNPLVTSSYGEAHSEPLQAVAEGGLAGVAAIGAFVALLAALARAARRGGPASAEAALLLSMLVAGGIGALTWFPLQRPISAIPLLLAAGRGWRISAESGEAP
ncbi:MAG TPA: O-antigen ligase family protein [Thermoanaerobaculia bacterium]|nr:O-antigen ligase family protein [Thermoanaerobaculia bacterium]